MKFSELEPGVCFRSSELLYSDKQEVLDKIFLKTMTFYRVFGEELNVIEINAIYVSFGLTCFFPPDIEVFPVQSHFGTIIKDN
jgi:hypothetical protein